MSAQRQLWITEDEGGGWVLWYGWKKYIGKDPGGVWHCTFGATLVMRYPPFSSVPDDAFWARAQKNPQPVSVALT